ncbi:DUF4012 domain-containing protein [Curtobacterium luteum]|uniref:DUF4012 domain-containing protein n=1 Tax=Curtobacterium luteum TaxID=33881 RepID=UPI003813E016
MSGDSATEDAGLRTGRRRRMTLLWVVVALVVVLAAGSAWLGVRGVIAERALERVAVHVGVVQEQLARGDTAAAGRAAAEVARDAERARRMTNDPIWTAAQYAPLVGGDFRAVRELGRIVDDVASGAVVPAVGVVDDVGVEAFRAEHGKVALEPLERARPAVERVAATLRRAERAAARIDTSGSVTPVADAVRTLRGAIGPVADQAAVVERVVRLAPSMLGAERPRRYLVLVQNNAELRAGGGIPGALAVLEVRDGAVSLGRQASTADFPRRDAPVLPLATDTRGLYGDVTGEFIQDVNLTPRFDTTARLASAMWRERFGEQVDGVVAVDPVTLGYLLRATGPVDVATGERLTSENAVRMLLSDVYARYPEPVEQDAFFATAAQAVFDRVASGEADPVALLDALQQGTREGRVRLWSADAGEQALLAGTGVAGGLPESGGSSRRFGVFLNDATGAKMDYYLEKTVAVGSAVCRRDGRPTWAVEVTLRNTAAADAGATLPEYVTGGGAFGVEPGAVRTAVAVYAPPGAIFLGAVQDGRTASPQTAMDDEHPVVQSSTLLRPGEETTIRVQFLGPRSDATTAVDAESTPTVTASRPRPLADACDDGT